MLSSVPKRANRLAPEICAIGADVHSGRSAKCGARRKGAQYFARLPVPKLEDTMKRFMYIAAPLCSPAEMKHVQQVWNEFMDGDGATLQRYFEQRALTMEHWFADYYLNGFLQYRGSLVVNFSPSLMFPPMPQYTGAGGQSKLGGKLLHALMLYKGMVDSNDLCEQHVGGARQHMYQSDMFFGTTRVPAPHMDRLVYGKDRPPVAHLVVAANSRFYEIPTLTSSGSPLSAGQFESQLERVRHMAHRGGKGHGVGVLTSMDRDSWAACRDKLKENATNAASIDSIESSHVVLCLDGEQPTGAQLGDKSIRHDEVHMANLLHGNGAQYSSANRWFDKCLLFVVSLDGYAGICYEHTPAEAPPLGHVMDFATERLLADDSNAAQPEGDVDGPAELTFVLDGDITRRIAAAKCDITQRANDVDFRFLHFDDYGKNVGKMHRVSPDSLLQMAMHLAYYKLHKQFPPTYETGSIKRFRYGRTEVVRLPNPESMEFVHTMLKDGESAMAKVESLRRAINAHKEWALSAMSGRLLDRYLSAMQGAAAHLGLAKPAILDTVAWKRLNYYLLSTSQVPTKYNVPTAFGPSAPDCYGVCYNPKEDSCSFSISTFKSHPATSGVRYRDALLESLRDVRQVLEDGTKARL